MKISIKHTVLLSFVFSGCLFGDDTNTPPQKSDMATDSSGRDTAIDMASDSRGADVGIPDIGFDVLADLPVSDDVDPSEPLTIDCVSNAWEVTNHESVEFGEGTLYPQSISLDWINVGGNPLVVVGSVQEGRGVFEAFRYDTGLESCGSVRSPDTFEAVSVDIRADDGNNFGFMVAGSPTNDDATVQWLGKTDALNFGNGIEISGERNAQSYGATIVGGWNYYSGTRKSMHWVGVDDSGRISTLDESLDTIDEQLQESFGVFNPYGAGNFRSIGSSGSFTWLSDDLSQSYRNFDASQPGVDRPNGVGFPPLEIRPTDPSFERATPGFLATGDGTYMSIESSLSVQVTAVLYRTTDLKLDPTSVEIELYSSDGIEHHTLSGRDGVMVHGTIVRDPDQTNALALQWSLLTADFGGSQVRYLGCKQVLLDGAIDVKGFKTILVPGIVNENIAVSVISFDDGSGALKTTLHAAPFGDFDEVCF